MLYIHTVVFLRMLLVWIYEVFCQKWNKTVQSITNTGGFPRKRPVLRLMPARTGCWRDNSSYRWLVTPWRSCPWLRHQMETFSALLAAQRPVTRSFDVFFDLGLNKRLSKQPWGWWFEMLSWSLWRQCNAMTLNASVNWVVIESNISCFMMPMRHKAIAWTVLTCMDY